MSAKLHFLTEDAENTLQEALKYEAMATSHGDENGTRTMAERRAYTALDRIQALAYYAKSLEDRLAAAEAKLYDAIDAEGPLALEAEIDGTV